MGVYGLARDAAGRALTTAAGVLPGGLVTHGEHPDDAVLRAVREQTGLTVRVDGVHAVTADISADGLVHTDRITYDITPVDAFTGGFDGIPPFPTETPADVRERRVQRFGAYARATDPDGRFLLTLISAGYPGAGLWHLPGGGTDFGETPQQGLTRELAEETSQRGHITGLLGVSHRYTPAELGPEGVPMDWQVIRALFDVAVDRPTEPVVTDEGGSTASARWFRPSELADLPLTEVARQVVGKPFVGVIS